MYLGWWCSAHSCQFGRPNSITPTIGFKGTMSRDFSLLVFFMNQFSPSPWVYHWGHFKFFRKFAEIFAAQGAPPVSLTLVANGKSSIIKVLIILFGHLWEVELTCRYIFACKFTLRSQQPDIVPIIFATSINNTSETGGKICCRCRWYRWQICHCRWYPWCTLTCKYLLEFSKKFETVLMEYSGPVWGWGETDSWKKPWSKKSCDTVPLKADFDKHKHKGYWEIYCSINNLL